VWTTVSVLIYAICSIAGRDHLLTIFNDFLALIGYWTIIWIVITAEEQVIFRWKIGYNWDDWNTKSLLPVGLAALAAFCVGWVGAVLSMYEVYFTGPIAALVGYGADVSWIRRQTCGMKLIISLDGHSCFCVLDCTCLSSTAILRKEISQEIACLTSYLKRMMNMNFYIDYPKFLLVIQ
jgi:hypothetical protein